MAYLRPLPVYSDRIARDFHPIPSFNGAPKGPEALKKHSIVRLLYQYVAAITISKTAYDQKNVVSGQKSLPCVRGTGAPAGCAQGPMTTSARLPEFSATAS